MAPDREANDDIITQSPDQPPAAQILDKYIQAVGGACRSWLRRLPVGLAKVSALVSAGSAESSRVTIFSKELPAMHTQLIEFPQSEGRGTSVRSFDGTNGWIRTPLTVLDEYALSGGELEGAPRCQTRFPRTDKE